MNTAIEFEHVSKQYRLGLVSTKTLSHDIRRFWITNVLGKEDPYLKIGETNDRASKGNSEYVWALRDIDFKVEQGDVVGIIGKNGAGKSTLLKLLSRVTGPTTGTIRAHGRIGSLLEVGTGFHGEMTGRENIFMNGAILGMSRAEIQSKLDEIIDFSGCERYIDTPVKRYSSGMTVRLGFAVAAFLEPEILVVDEVLAVGDAEFQKKAIGKMKDVSQGQGRTVLFVSHNMASIRNLCKTGILLEKGTVKFKSDDINEVVNVYIKDNEFTAGNIIDGLRVTNKCLHIDSVLINGKPSNSVKLERGEDIQISIAGKTDVDSVIELEAQLYDEGHILLGSFCPCLLLGRGNRYKGDFVINETIALPENITEGKYHLEFQLTQPNIEYHATTIRPIEINTSGLDTMVGERLNYKHAGFVVL